MTRRDDYIDDEWTLLLAAPRAAGGLVIFADLHVTGMLGEFKALGLALTDRTADGADNALVQSLIDAVDDYDGEDVDDDKSEDGDDAKERSLDLLRSAARLVDGKATPEEAAGYRHWILGAALATAEARKESAFFGIGGERVSDDERVALAEISTALGIGDD